MKTNPRRVATKQITFGLALSLLVFVQLACIAQEKEFALVKQDGNIAIYERWITFPNTHPPIPAREVKSEFVYNNSIYAGVELLRNEDKISQWQSHLTEFDVHLQSDTNTWLEYSYHDIPWPVSDQDHLLIYKLQEKKPDQEVYITFETVHNESLAPVKTDVTRMNLSGSWTFEQITPGKTKATYRILSKPMNIPRWVTDPIIRNNMMKTIKSFISIMEESD